MSSQPHHYVIVTIVGIRATSPFYSHPCRGQLVWITNLSVFHLTYYLPATASSTTSTQNTQNRVEERSPLWERLYFIQGTRESEEYRAVEK